MQNDPDKISVSQEYLHGLRVALDTERRRVEELESEVCRLNKELAAFKVKIVLHRQNYHGRSVSLECLLFR